MSVRRLTVLGGLAIALVLALVAAGQAAPLFEQKKLTPFGITDGYGRSVSVSGDTAIVGTEGSGAFIYQRDEGGPNNWGLVKLLTVSDLDIPGLPGRFGFQVAISGAIVVVGVNQTEAAYVFHRDRGGANNWGEVKRLAPSDATLPSPNGLIFFSHGVAVDGDTIVIGAFGESSAAHNAGAAYVYQRNRGGADNWGEVTKLTASDPQVSVGLGFSVAISNDTVVAGAVGTKAAYVYERDQGGADNWGEVKKLTGSDVLDELFGKAVGVSGDVVAVGARVKDIESSVADPGEAYVFQRDEGGAGNWGEVKKLVSSDAALGDAFGWDVAVSGNTAIVGARQEGEAGEEAGAVYIFQQDNGGADNWGELAKLTASDAGAFDRFGYSVSISGDTAVVGTQLSFAAYVFGGTPYTAPPTPVGGIAFDPELSALPAVEAAPPADSVGAINGVRVFARIRPVAVAALSLGVAVALWWLRTRRA